MLVLSRKAGEKITIGDGITVTVSRISGGRVTLAIEAPANVRILRGELSPFADSAPSEEVRMTMQSMNNGTPGMSPLATALPPAIARRAMLPPVRHSASPSPNSQR